MRAGAIPVLALALVAGCSGQGDESATVTAADIEDETGEAVETIECAVGGASQLEKVCPVERIRRGDKLELVVIHPNGGFRRFLVTTDGRGLVPADGAQQIALEFDARGFADVRIGDDRYLFPATRIKP